MYFNDSLEPALFVLDVSSHKLFIRLRQVDNALNDAEYVANTTRQKSDHQLNNSFSRVTE